MSVTPAPANTRITPEGHQELQRLPRCFFDTPSVSRHVCAKGRDSASEIKMRSQHAITIAPMLSGRLQMKRIHVGLVCRHCVEVKYPLREDIAL